MRLRNIPGSREIIAKSEFVVQRPEEKKGNWRSVFGSGHPIELEIGIGKGRFLMDMAQRYPERNFIGIEMYSSVLFRAIQLAEQRATGAETPLPVRETERPRRPADCNFRLLRFDATALTQLFEKGEIGRIYLNFSDPWPKDRHADRRLTSARFLSRYAQILESGSELVFKTDDQALFAYSLEQVRACDWKLLAVTDDLHGSRKDRPAAPETEALRRGNVMTEYEEKFAAEGKPICMLRAAAP